MPRNRRQILKAAGAVGVGSLLTVGSASANGDCVVTVDEYTQSDGAASGTLPLVGTGPAPTGVYATVGPFSTEAFADAEFDGRRIKVSYQWNPTPQGPTSSEVRLERQVVEGQWESLGGKSTGDLEPTGQNSIEFQVSGEDVINDGDTYRLYIDQPNKVGVIPTYEAKAEFQAFDPSCLEESE